MSVQQVKKQFEAMAGYLGRDVKGLEQLKALKDAVNVLRTSLASAQEQAARDAAVQQLATKRALAAERDLADARVELESLRQQVTNLTRDLEIATRPEPVHEETEREAVIATMAGAYDELKSVVKQLRKRLRFCPPVNHVTRKTPERVPHYTRESFSTGWSHDSLWVLGASVAFLCLLSDAVVIHSARSLRDTGRGEQDDEDDEVHEGMQRHLLQWFGKNNMEMDTKHDTSAGFVRVRNVQDGLCQVIDEEIHDTITNAVASRGTK